MRFYKRWILRGCSSEIPLFRWVYRLLWSVADRLYERQAEVWLRTMSESARSVARTGFHDAAIRDTTVQNEGMILVLDCAESTTSVEGVVRLVFTGGTLVIQPQQGARWLYEEYGPSPDGRHRCQVLCDEGEFVLDFDDVRLEVQSS